MPGLLGLRGAAWRLHLILLWRLCCESRQGGRSRCAYGWKQGEVAEIVAFLRVKLLCEVGEREGWDGEGQEVRLLTVATIFLKHCLINYYKMMKFKKLKAIKAIPYNPGSATTLTSCPY